MESLANRGSTFCVTIATAYLLKWAFDDERRVLTVSRLQEGALGLRDVCLSLPVIVGRDGAVDVLEPELSEAERAGLLHAADVLREAHGRAVSRP